MSSSLPPVLVLGATGQIASEVVRMLVSHSPPVSVTAGVRNLDKAKASLPSQAKLVHADFADAASIGAAVNTSHAKKVFIYADGVKPEVLSTLKSAGVTHVVCVSSNFVGLLSPSNVIVAHCERFETAIKDAGFSYTILRGEAFQSNVLQWKYSIAQGGTVKLPYPDAPIPAVAQEDIAAVGVQALTSNKLDNKKVNIIGPEPITQRQEVAILSKQLGKPIQVEKQAPEAWVADNKAYAPPGFMDALLEYLQFRQSHGGEVQSKADLEVKGKVHFQQWVEKHAPEFKVGPPQ